MKLFEITRAYKDVEQMIEDEDIDNDQACELLDQVQDLFEDKVLNITRLIKVLDEKADAIRCVESRVKQYLEDVKSRREAKEKKVEWLTNYLISNMVEHKQDSLEFPEFKVSVRANPASVVIDNEAEIPPDFIRQVVKKSPDKTLIKQALSDGEDVPGAHLAKTRRLTIK